MSQDDDGQQGLVLTIVFGLIALVVALVIGLGIYQSGQDNAPATALAASTPAAAVVPVAATAQADTATAANAAQAASDAASIKVENGVVKFYFATGKADLAAGAGDADVVQGAKAGRKLVISGFHDATGDAAKNAELAKQRALAVRDALKAAGVTEQQIELKKPEQLTASGSNAEARRVEVVLSAN